MNRAGIILGWQSALGRARTWRPARFRRPGLPELVLGAGAACLVLSVLFVLAAPAAGALRARACERAVRSNAATVQLAAETYAAVHRGRYPGAPAELIPYLPSKSLPRNPYTRRASGFKGEAGDLTYRSESGGGSYRIQAWGRGISGKPQLLATLEGHAAADLN